LRTHLLQLQTKKPVILCGDLNVAHQEIDIANPKSNKNNPGFTQQERDSFTKLLEGSFVDVFRHFHKHPHRYTWWSNFFNSRAKNIGWRLDYHVASSGLLPRIEDSRILADIYGSDHCPVLLELKD
jgi:exodeoxyribonuclease-3